MGSYKVSGIHIAHQNIDGEVIIVDLQTGSYFSTTGSGPSIWAALIQGASHDQIVDQLAHVFAATRGDIQDAVNSFVERLKSEGLIIDSAVGAAPCKPPDMVPVETGKRPFGPATLDKYTDLEQALILDPIHDYDETGWPNQPVVINQFHTA